MKFKDKTNQSRNALKSKQKRNELRTFPNIQVQRKTDKNMLTKQVDM